MSIQAYAFDLDGVITSSSQEHFDAWKTLATDLGFELADEIEESTKGVGRMDSLNIVLAAGGMSDRFSDREKADLADKKNRLYVSLIDQFTPERLLPGVRPLLEKLRTDGIGTVLASASRNGPMLLERLGIEDLLDAVVDPASVGRGKPAPDIFLAAAAALGAEPARCIGVEDAIAGVRAVKDAGMFAVGIGDPEILFQADVVYPDCSYIQPERIAGLHSGNRDS